ncbi:hypothetical protein J4212_07110 [Candidatus Woesearchaeota archaeon]|nr:hypothetical protein [Candidatus Woesearchaeota archaeon]
MHFYESTIITTKEGMHCQVYGNEHPPGRILVKPKYIPTDRISSDALPSRFLSGKKMNRLDLWINREKLSEYIKAFIRAYPGYIYKSDMHDISPLFFAIPKENIEKEYSPRDGLRELMSIPPKDMDFHLKTVSEFAALLMKSGLKLGDFGITYSTLMGHYSQNISDINIVVYGKKKFWELMKYLEKAQDKDLRWKTYEEWEHFYTKRNRHMVHKKETYIENMHRKKSEGFFKNTLFVIFAVENEGETWFKWGQEHYKKIGHAKVKAKVSANADSIVRPGCYAVSGSKFVSGDKSCENIKIDKVAFYSRDYCMLAYPGENIEVSGTVEEVSEKSGRKHNRIVVGYFDSYISGMRDGEYIRVLDN